MAETPPLLIALAVTRGYMRCRLEQGQQRLSFDGSHLIDSFRQMAEAVAAVARGESSAEAVFDFEPVYYRLIVERAGAEARCLVVEGCEYAGTDRLLFRGSAPLLEFARAALDAFSELLGRVGADRYRSALHGLAFPEEAVTRLRLALEQLAARTQDDEPPVAADSGGI